MPKILKYKCTTCPNEYVISGPDSDTGREEADQHIEDNPGHFLNTLLGYTQD